MIVRLASLFVLACAVVSCGGACVAAENSNATILFLIAEEEYETAKTLPAFFEKELKPLGYAARFVYASEDDPNRFEGLEDALDASDLLFLSVRRRTPSPEQMAAIRGFLKSGKPLVGIRTASHALAPPLRQEAPEGAATWPEFDVEVLGAKYEGHLGSAIASQIRAMPAARKHPILKGIEDASFPSGGTLYRNVNMAETTTQLLEGVAEERGQEVRYPVAWTNQYGDSRVFYTSLGHVDDFKRREFNRMLVNAVAWCLDNEKSSRAGADAGEADQTSTSDAHAANERVSEVMRTFEGRGAVGDNSDPLLPEEAQPKFVVSDDLAIELVLSEPAVRQPVHMTWDTRGRLWIVQYLQYPFPAGLKIVKYDEHLRAVFDHVPNPPPHHTPGADKVTVFEDTDGDGKFDASKDVLSGLNIVSSVAIGAGGIWVLNPPYLLFYPDADGDDVPDADPEVRLSGFGLEDTHAIANSLTWGPDGWLYGANGSTTTGVITGGAGPDTAFEGQMIWRYHPRSREFEMFGEGGGNTFNVEINAAGHIFSGTNVGDARGMHYVQGGYGQKSWGKHGPLTNAFAFGYFPHMAHEGDPQRFTHSLLVYEGGALPARYNGALFAANPLHNRIIVSDLLPATSTYRTKDRGDVLTTSDQWFRPVDMKLGPDGAIYIADWYDTRLTHLDPRDNWHKASGRIYRLRAKGTPPEYPTNLRDMSDDALIALFDHPNRWHRFQAVQLLGERNNVKIVPRLVELLTNANDARALGALWTLNWMDRLTDEVVLTALAHSSADVRRWAVRLTGDRKEASPAVIERLTELAASEPEAQVRSQLASSAKRLPAGACLSIVDKLTQRSSDLDDLHLPLLIWWALESKAETARDQVLAFFAEPSVWSRPIIERHLTSRVMRRYALTEDYSACAKLLAQAPSSDSRKLLVQGMLAAYQGREITGLPAELTEALEEYQHKIGQDDLVLGIRLRQKAAIAKAMSLARDKRTELSLRLTYVNVLGEVRPPECEKPLLNLLTETDESALQQAVLLALAGYTDSTVGERIMKAFKSTLSSDAQTQGVALRVLAGRSDWARMLLAAVDDWQIDRTQIPLDVVSQIAMHGESDLDSLIEKHWGALRRSTPDDKRNEIERVRALLAASGAADRIAGRGEFQKSCGKCHRLFGEGATSAPDLTSYERTNLDFLLLAIVDPSAAIREEYTNFGVQTVDGRLLTGLLEDQNDQTITLRDASGAAVLIQRDQIEELQALDTSIMPEGLLSTLSDAEIRNLFAYLTSRTPPVAAESATGAAGAR